MTPALIGIALTALGLSCAALVWLVKIGIAYGVVTTELTHVKSALEKLDKKVDMVLFRGDGT